MAVKRVPKSSATAAILFVSQMEHMPHEKLLGAILKRAIQAVVSWKASGEAPTETFGAILRTLRRDGWSGSFFYTSGPGMWEHEAFAAEGTTRPEASPNVEHSKGVQRPRALSPQRVVGLQPAALPGSAVHAAAAWKQRVNIPRYAIADRAVSKQAPMLASPQQPVSQQKPFNRPVPVKRVQAFLPPGAI